MIGLIDLVFKAFELLILARVLMSWVQVDSSNQIGRFIFEATEPFLRPVRRYMPQSIPLDFSPLVVLLAAMVLEGVLLQLLR
ncbi:MAG TPA: YggT family protein [Aggregatilineales bacterium]|nr:YggT family protein [Aggregatilineales bacterium]